MVLCLGCGVFGRDEGGVEQHFSFNQHHVEVLITRWSNIVRRQANGATSKPTPGTVMALDLSISDLHKPLLLANPQFLPYVVRTVPYRTIASYYHHDEWYYHHIEYCCSITRPCRLYVDPICVDICCNDHQYC
jgi:hypothetical protein